MTAARLCLLIAGLYGVLAVAFGAFGSHALRARLPVKDLEIWHTAVQYQFYHLLALFGVAVLMMVRPAAGQGLAAIFFAAGILLFSGSLYVLVLSGVRVLGVVTPIGGLLLIAGWVALAVSAVRG
ncbi:MAG TPA: DUF423 domain-containing protein [Nevskiaceae bacterium]|nr:DUF423 domain-containing protein [Nevskiaceae bacterium]